MLQRRKTSSTSTSAPSPFCSGRHRSGVRTGRLHRLHFDLCIPSHRALAYHDPSSSSVLYLFLHRMNTLPASLRLSIRCQNSQQASILVHDSGSTITVYTFHPTPVPLREDFRASPPISRLCSRKVLVMRRGGLVLLHEQPLLLLDHPPGAISTGPLAGMADEPTS